MMRKNLKIILFICITFLTGISQAQEVEKLSVLWCDPLQNIKEFNTRSGILNIVNKAYNAGFKALAVGVKTSSGEVLFESALAPRLLDWRDYRVSPDFDPIRIFLEEGRKRNLQVYAVFPLFSEGSMIEQQGPVYADHRDWQTMVYVVDEEEPVILPITDWAYGATAFVNPLSPAVQNYEISVVSEFLDEYTVDGIIFDKGRFFSIESDFSESSKQLFQTYISRWGTIEWWPEDVMELQFTNDEWQLVPGKYYQQWIEFRSQSMKNFFGKLIKAVNSKDSSLPIGNFVGAWYPMHYEYGVNWASESNLPEEDWATRSYYRTATAELFDYLIVGCFFARINMEDAENLGAPWWLSVEGGATLAKEVVDEVSPVYASILVEQYKDDGEKFQAAIKKVIELTDGLYIHDFKAIDKYGFWDEIRSVLKGVEAASKLQRDF